MDFLGLPSLRVVSAALLVLTLTGCTAGAFSGPSLALDVQSAVASGSINVRLIEGTAILTGRVESLYDSMAAERAAARYEGVDAVINRITVVRCSDRFFNTSDC